MAELREAVAGPVLRRSDVGYTNEVAVYNPVDFLAPVAAVGVTGVADVQAVVRFAAKHDLPVAIRATGHQVALHARGALLINTSRMDGVSVDEIGRIARVEAGVRWSAVIDEAARYGLAPMSGSSPDVGVVGYTLGGGQSPVLGRSLGWAADHVREIEVVTADGELRHVTADREPDLFWALRGGKGNFGVVTAITFDLFEVGTFYGGSMYLPGARIAEVLPIWRTWAGTLPEQATTSIAAERTPALPELPRVLRNSFVLHVRFAFLGSAEAGERLIAPIRAIAPALIDGIQTRPYTETATIHLPRPAATPYYSRTTTLSELSDKVLDALVELTGPDSDCPLAMVEIRALGGALDREPPVPNAVPTRGIPYVVNAFGVSDLDEEELMDGYLDEVVDVLAPWAVDGRRTVNFLGSEEAVTRDQMRRVYGAQRYDRLADIKRRFDPGNMFRINHNIAPQ
ncbi:FAD-binding oxidoreductase [Actinoplanes sp. TBRC 11911]|nr:FAD-binding oxidoreductase [Actinoplanes sp. TBRC 11911]